MNTPLIVATVGKNKHEFFTDEEYQQWTKTAPKHTKKYFKGLGGFNTADFKRFLSDAKYTANIKVESDEDLKYLDIAFDSNKADERKEWLMED